ncbi:MAG: hypothetical protein BRD57_02320 [Proteobacteria bacterium SW_6_67_9]|nr:MAG: hypothetical protein BRD57_02320 [Proteobacteria bacterium SW_6_67_9]
MAPDLLLATGLGLLAFVEPCSIGIHLLLIGYLERLPPGRRALELAKVTLVRATTMGLIGLAAAWIGRELFTAQRGLWIAFGLLYVALGALYLSGRQGVLLRALTPASHRLQRRWRAWGVGLTFGLYVPACAVPLLLVLVGLGAAQSATGADMASGFLSLFIFGVALSAPLFALVGTAVGQRWLDRLVCLAGHLPRPTGALFAALGVLSLGLALFSDGPSPPA